MGLQQQTAHARAVRLRLQSRRRAGMATDDHVRITVPSSSLPPSTVALARSGQRNGTAKGEARFKEDDDRQLGYFPYSLNAPERLRGCVLDTDQNNQDLSASFLGILFENSSNP